MKKKQQMMMKKKNNNRIMKKKKNNNNKKRRKRKKKQLRININKTTSWIHFYWMYIVCFSLNGDINDYYAFRTQCVYRI